MTQHNNRSRSRRCLSKVFWGVLVTLLLFLVVLMFPIWIYEEQTQFSLSNAKLREAKYLLGIQYKAGEEMPTMVSAYLPSNRLAKAEREWVLVRHRGVLFPTDLLKWYHSETPSYGTVLLDIKTLESIWARRTDMSVEEKEDMAGGYMSYLRKDDPRSATIWLNSIFEKELKKPNVEKKNFGIRLEGVKNGGE